MVNTNMLHIHDWNLSLTSCRLIVANSISLFFGVTANITTLLIRGDNSFSLSKHVLELVFITIACGFAAALVLISCVVAAFYELRYPVPPKHAFTDAYFYAIEAAALYFITSAFIIYTAYMLWKSRRTRDDLSKQFAGGHLSLKILTVIFAAYILLGALVFSNIENWRYLDAVFWADVTILTVGFGDFRPQTHLGKSLIFPYAAFGVFFLVLILYCITQVVFERGSSLWEARIRDQERRREVQKRKFRGRMVKKELAPPEIQLSLPSFSFSRKIDKRTTHPASHLVSKNSTQTEKFTRSSRQHEARERRRVDFEKMRDIALYATSRRIFLSIFLWFLFSIFLWFGGAMLFYLSEHKQGWTYFNAVYFTFVALLTIGYGDNNLLSMPGKAIFVLWSLIVIPSLTMLISTGSELVGMPYLTSTKRWVKRRFKRRRGAEKKLKGEGRRLASMLLLLATF
jgi:potassium channel subfamily K